MFQSTMFSVSTRDFIHGFIVAVLTAVIDYIGQIMTAPDFTFTNINWHTLLTMSVVAGFGYLSKKFLSDSQGNFGGIV